jgi:hypothetical protein
LFPLWPQNIPLHNFRNGGGIEKREQMHSTLGNNPTDGALRSLRTPDPGLTCSPQLSFLRAKLHQAFIVASINVEMPQRFSI